MKEHTEGDKVYQEGIRKLSNTSWTSWIFSSGDRLEKAAELFEKASNKYKLERKWIDAGNALIKASECYKRLDNDLEVTTKYTEAAFCFKKEDKKLAIDPLEKAIKCYTDRGKFLSAAKFSKELAEIVEEYDVKESIKYYKNAKEWYQVENFYSHANSCTLKMAQMLTREGEYEEAIRAWDELLDDSKSENVSNIYIKDYCMKSIMCLICLAGTEESKIKLRTYSSRYPFFPATREFELLDKIISSMDNNDIKTFEDDMNAYDKLLRGDHLRVSLQDKIKMKFYDDPDIR